MGILVGIPTLSTSQSPLGRRRWEEPDHRVGAIVTEKSRQLSRDVPNVLVVDVSAFSGGRETWRLALPDVLQPRMRSNVGAVVLVHGGVYGHPPALRRRWEVIRNPHARVAVPQSLLERIESLDEPWA